jgi:anaerobic dimethyl sulfoxide reductase subunit C (anchor subunit)
MGRTGPHPGGGFHELPLVLFTAMGMAGGGIGAARVLQGALSGRLPTLTRAESILLSVLLGTGFLISAWHLGRPLRGHLALRGLGRSPLSNEVVALGVTLTGALLGAGLPPTHRLQGVSDLVAGVGSVAFLLAVGVVYRLPGQLAWRGMVVFHPLVLGTTWGLLMTDARLGSPTAEATLRTVLVALLVDGVLVLVRNAAMERAGRKGAASYPGVFRFRGLVMGARLASSALLTPLALLEGQWWIAVGILSLACLLDRFGFYALSVRQTTESEVARVEALL